MTQDNFNIERLKNDIERKLNRSIKSPIDFSFLSNEINKALNETLSASTLQRIWNYVATTSTPRNSTLSLLSRFLGYSGWDSYVADLLRRKTNESDYVITKLIRTIDLREGDILRIGWLPNRECIIRYSGNFYFKVVSSVNSKLQVGDTFMAMSFSLGNTLQISNLRGKGDATYDYEAGKKSGLTTLELLPPYEQY